MTRKSPVNELCCRQKVTDESSRVLSAITLVDFVHGRRSTTGTRMSNVITQLYLPPDRDDVPAVIQPEAGTRFRLNWPKEVDANILLKDIAR